MFSGTQRTDDLFTVIVVIACDRDDLYRRIHNQILRLGIALCLGKELPETAELLSVDIAQRGDAALRMGGKCTRVLFPHSKADDAHPERHRRHYAGPDAEEAT